MIYLVLCLFVVGSAHARVALAGDKLPEITENLINEKLNNTTLVRIDLPVSEVVNGGDKLELDKPDKEVIKDALVTAKPNKTKCSTADKEIIDNVIDPDEIEPCLPDEKIDNGTALMLTPYIEGNKIDEARNACRVNPELFVGVESYSGFLTVDKKYGSNMFFWYFPIEKKPVKDSPWIIWLQGGPGASSMTGLFDEIGPFSFVKGSLERNPNTWLRNHSLVFIDNPVGTGYSHTAHFDGFVRDMNTYGAHLYAAVKQLVTLFPELRAAPLFVAGESYAGKYVPALAVNIHRHRAEEKINLKGLIVGNGYMDPAMLANMVRPFYYFGLLGAKQIADVQPLLTAFQQDIKNNKSVEAKEKWTHLITLVLLLTHQKHAYNFLRDDLPLGSYMLLLRRPEIKRALHVGDIQFSFINTTVNILLAGDFLSNARPLYEELLDHYRVLAYCGQLDQMLPCVFSSENYRSWRWGAAQEFLNATRYPYIYSGRLAGYQKEGGGFTEALIRGAGHMVPLDSPAPLRHLVARWVQGLPLSQRFGLLEGSFVQEFVRNTTRLESGNYIYL